MLFLNGQKIESVEHLELLIADLSDYQKQCLRNDFFGIPNEPLSVPPKQVTPRQIRLALIGFGITLDQIDAALDSLPEPTRSLAKVEWEYASVFERSHQLIPMVATSLGWNEQQLDQLWIEAAKL